MCNYEYISSILEKKGIICKPGLHEQDILTLEKKYNFIFPQEYKILLTKFIPIGDNFIDRSNINFIDIKSKLDWPCDGILWEIEHNNFRYEEWGQVPNNLDAKLTIAKSFFNTLPLLVPLYGHRYISQINGGPIFSIMGTDIIYYGSNLENYIDNEFGDKKLDRTIDNTIQIPFWSDLVS